MLKKTLKHCEVLDELHTYGIIVKRMSFSHKGCQLLLLLQVTLFGLNSSPSYFLKLPWFSSTVTWNILENQTDLKNNLGYYWIQTRVTCKRSRSWQPLCEKDILLIAEAYTPISHPTFELVSRCKSDYTETMGLIPLDFEVKLFCLNFNLFTGNNLNLVQFVRINELDNFTTFAYESLNGKHTESK